MGMAPLIESVPVTLVRDMGIAGFLMWMPMMDIGEMRMGMHDGRMPMPVLMRLAAIPIKIMAVLVMHIVDMRMAMFLRLVRMLMLMVLGQMQPYSPHHQTRCQPECR